MDQPDAPQGRNLIVATYAILAALLLTAELPDVNRVGMLIFLAGFGYVFLTAVGVLPPISLGRRFSLRSALVVVTALALLLGWLRLVLRR
jgi:hypothetical protein